MQSQVWNLEAYREEGAKARKNGQPKHSNPYDYSWEALAANAWDDGWEAAA